MDERPLAEARDRKAGRRLVCPAPDCPPINFEIGGKRIEGEVVVKHAHMGPLQVELVPFTPRRFPVRIRIARIASLRDTQPGLRWAALSRLACRKQDAASRERNLADQNCGSRINQPEIREFGQIPATTRPPNSASFQTSDSLPVTYGIV